MESGLKVRFEVCTRVEFISIVMEVSSRHRSGMQLRVVLGLGLGLDEIKPG